MKALMQIIFLILMSPVLKSHDFKGEWDGMLHIQEMEFKILFHVTKTENGYEATMDSPDQNASGIRITATTFKCPDVKFEISTTGMVYEGYFIWQPYHG